MQRIERDVENVEGFAKFLQFSNPGDRCCYHRGVVIADRQVSARSRRLDFSTLEQQKLDHLATMAMQSAECGVVELVQRRNGEDDYSYLAVRTDKQVLDA